MKDIKVYIIAILCLIIGFVFSHSCTKDQLLEAAELREVELKKDRNDLGELIVKTNYQLVSSRQMEATKDSNIIALAKEVGGMKKIISTIQFKSVNSGSVTTTIRDSFTLHDNDTLHYRLFDYTDQWIKFKGTSTGNKQELSYRLKDDFGVTTFWQKNGFLKRDSIGLMIKSRNPNTDITSVRPLFVVSPPKKWYETRLAAFVTGALTATGIIIAR